MDLPCHDRLLLTRHIINRFTTCVVAICDITLSALGFISVWINIIIATHTSPADEKDLKVPMQSHILLPSTALASAPHALQPLYSVISLKVPDGHSRQRVQ